MKVPYPPQKTIYMAIPRHTIEIHVTFIHGPHHSAAFSRESEGGRHQISPLLKLMGGSQGSHKENKKKKAGVSSALIWGLLTPPISPDKHQHHYKLKYKLSSNNEVTELQQNSKSTYMKV